MLTCPHNAPYWKACMQFTHTVLGVRAGVPTLDAVVFNHDGKTLLSEATRAFLRHAVGKWYASMTATHRENTAFVWQATYLATLHGFRNAVLRWCYSIRKQYANRRYTNLTAQVADTTRASYPTLVQLTPQGEHTLTNVFLNAITNAEGALHQHSAHLNQGPLIHNKI